MMVMRTSQFGAPRKAPHSGSPVSMHPTMHGKRFTLVKNAKKRSFQLAYGMTPSYGPGMLNATSNGIKKMQLADQGVRSYV
jgi:hypothetical protein